MNPSTHPHVVFVTGTTGLVGSELLRRYLAAENARVYALIRATDETRLQHRFQELVTTLGHRPEQVGHQVTPVRGDVSAPDLGLVPEVADRLAGEVTHVVHCATDIHFARPLDAARRVNLLGVVNLTDQVRRWRRLEALVHVSTAHVAGRRTGRIFEDELVHDAGFVNTYEQSKYEAEVYLRGLMGDLPIAVYRSSSLIGDSRTGEVRQFNFLHQTLRLFANNLVPVLPGDPDGPVDLIPVDWLADALMYLTHENFEPGVTYHLCAGAERSFTLGELVDFTVRCLQASPYRRGRREIHRPEIVDLATFEALRREAEAAGRTRQAQALRALSHFIPQMALPKAFDTTRARRALAPPGIELPPIAEYYPRVVDYCLCTNWGRQRIEAQET